MGDLDKTTLSSTPEGGGVRASVASPLILLRSKFFILNALAMSTVVFSVNFGVNWAVATSNPMKQMTFSPMATGITWAFLAAITALRFSTSCVHHGRIRRGVDPPLESKWYTSHVLIRTGLFSLSIINWRLPAFILNVLIILALPLTLIELFSCSARDDFNGLKCHEPVRWKFCAGDAAGKAVCAALITMMNYIAAHNDLRFKPHIYRQSLTESGTVAITRNIVVGSEEDIIVSTTTMPETREQEDQDIRCVGREQQELLGSKDKGNLQCECLLENECCS